MQPQPNPYSAPLQTSATSPVLPNTGSKGLYVGREGNQLVVQQTAALPAFCVKTGQPAQHFIRRTYYWHSPFIFITILAGLLVYVILALVLRKKIVVDIPWSEEAFLKLRRKRLVCTLMMIFSVVGMLGAIVSLATFGQTMPEVLRLVAGFSLPAMFLLLVVFAIVHGQASAILKPTKITDHHAWFKGCDSTFLAQVDAYAAQMHQQMQSEQRNH